MTIIFLVQIKYVIYAKRYFKQKNRAQRKMEETCEGLMMRHYKCECPNLSATHSR